MTKDELARRERLARLAKPQKRRLLMAAVATVLGSCTVSTAAPVHVQSEPLGDLVVVAHLSSVNTSTLWRVCDQGRAIYGTGFNGQALAVVEDAEECTTHD